MCLKRRLRFSRKEIFREFPEIGLMKCMTSDESNCTSWSKFVDYLYLRDALLQFADPVDNDENMVQMISQYKMAEDNAEAVRLAVDADPVYISAIQNGINPERYVGMPCIYMFMFDKKGNPDPRLEIAYETENCTIGITIRNGQMTDYSVSDNGTGSET